MKLYRRAIVDGKPVDTEVVNFPRNLASSKAGLINFFRLYAGRVFGGREGRDWRIIQQEREVVSCCVKQLVTTAQGAEYGDSLLVH
jgi:hypothetical protein